MSKKRNIPVIITGVVMALLLCGILKYRSSANHQTLTLRFVDGRTGEPVNHVQVTAQENRPNLIQHLFEELGFTPYKPIEHVYACTNGVIERFRLCEGKGMQTELLCLSPRYEPETLVYVDGKWGSMVVLSSLSTDSLPFSSNGILTIKLDPVSTPQPVINR
jgi:hypothetical protein